jgi:hypothetical protein
MYGGGCRYLRIELEVQRRRGKEFTPTLGGGPAKRAAEGQWRIDAEAVPGSRSACRAVPPVVMSAPGGSGPGLVERAFSF